MKTHVMPVCFAVSFFGICLLTAGFSATAQDAPPAAPETPAEAAPVPEIYCAEPVYEFGEKDNTHDVEHDFIIQNKGGAPLTIKDVKTSCGCTAAKPDKNVLAPGEQTKIHTKLSLKRRQGPQNKSITVYTNDPKEGVYRLQLQGTAIAAIMIEPRVINFGKLLDEKPEPQHVTIYTPKEDYTFTIESVDASALPGFNAEKKVIEDGKKYEITVTCVEDLKTGRYHGSVRLQTDKDDNKTQTFNVFAQVVGKLDVAPEIINLRYSDEPGKTSSQYIRIAPGRIQEYEITEVVTPVNTMSAEIMPRGQNTYLIKLTDMPLDDSLDEKQLIVKTNNPEVPEFKVPFKVLKLNRPSRYVPKPPAKPAPQPAAQQ
jgi:hypothetical protein